MLNELAIGAVTGVTRSSAAAEDLLLALRTALEWVPDLPFDLDFDFAFDWCDSIR